MKVLKIYLSSLLFVVLGISLGYSQDVNINGSCIVGVQSMVYEGDVSVQNYNGKPVYNNATVSITYQTESISTNVYVAYLLAGELSTPENRWVVLYDGQPYYYFISDAAAAPSGEYLPFDTDATLSDCGGSVFISIPCDLFSMSNPGTYCASTSGTSIGLSGSELGISYQLYLDGIAIGSVVAGTGSAISFGTYTDVGTYTVKGVECDTMMTGSTIINSLPEIAVSALLSCGSSGASVSIVGVETMPIVNPDFEILTAPNSSATAPPFTPFQGCIGTDSSNMLGTTVTFSDGSEGNMFNSPGWNFDSNSELGFTNVNPQVSGERNTIVFINGASFGGGTAEKTLSQELTTQVEQMTTYTLTADFGWRSDNSIGTNPPVLRLYAGGTLLTPDSSTSPALVQGQYVTYSRTYTINNNAISGALKIQLGLGANTDGQQLNIDHVALYKGDNVYTYAWNTDPIQTSPIAINLTAGEKTVTVTDLNGCSTSASVTIVPFENVTAEGSTIKNICIGNSASLSVSGASGYSWSPGTGLNQTSGATVIASPTQTTTYTVAATDAGGCSTTFTVNVNPLPEIAVSPLLSCGSSGASVSIVGVETIPIVNPDFEILTAPNSSATAPAFSPLLGCMGTDSSNMSGPTVTFSDGSVGNIYSSPGWSFDNNSEMGFTNVNPRISGERNTVAFINGASFGGGTAEKTLSQELTTQVEQMTTYTLTADFGWRTDNSIGANPLVLRLYAGGTLLTPGSSTSPALIQGQYVTYSRTYTINNNTISGALKVQLGLGANTDGQQLNIDHVALYKGDNVYTYAWNTDPIQTSPVATNLAAGENTVTVTDGNGCVASATVTIVPYAEVTAVGSTSETICAGESVTLNVSGATDYVWSPAIGLNQTSGSSVIASPTETTEYTITSADLGSCFTSMTVNVNPLPIMPMLSSNAPVCAGEDLTLAATVAPLQGYDVNSNSGIPFIDISATGTAIENLVDDGRYQIAIPSFTFDNVVYTNAMVSNNGFVVFGATDDGNLNFGNVPLPTAAFSPTGSDAAICAFWDDLIPVEGTSLTTQTIGNLFIIQWTAENQWILSSQPETITFQIQLDLISGEIHFVYSDVFFDNVNYDFGASATIGLNYSTTDALLYSNNTPSIQNGQSITFPLASYDYFWTGPNGFSSTSASPVLSGITTAAGGDYYLQITNPLGCSIGSSPLTITVNPTSTPTVALASSDADNNFAYGTAVTFTATPSNMAGGIVSYDFKVDGASVQSGASNTYAVSNLTDGQQVSVAITVTDGLCLTTDTANSNAITNTVTGAVATNFIYYTNCGATADSINPTFYCTAPNVGASTLSYRFKIKNMVTSLEETVNRMVPNANLLMTNLLAYNTLYSVKVAAVVDGLEQPYSADCTVTTPALATNQVVPNQCGSTLAVMNSTINVFTTPAAQNYRFRVALSTAPSTYEYVMSAFPSFRLTSLTTLPLDYNKTYLVAVQSDILNNGFAATSAYGAECTISTPSPVTITPTPNQCGSTLAEINSRIYVNSVPGANQYTYRVAMASNPGVYNDIVTPFTNFRLSSLTTVPLMYATTYVVSVNARVMVGGSPIETGFGPACSYTTPMAPSTPLTPPVVARVIDTPFSAFGTPNPFAAYFTLTITSNSASIVSIKVYDMLGRLIEERSSNVTELETTTMGDHYPSGVYNVIVTQDDDVSTVRMIKR